MRLPFTVIPTPKSFDLKGGFLSALHPQCLFQITHAASFPGQKTVEILTSEIADMSEGACVFNSKDKGDFAIHLIRDETLANSSPEAYRLSIDKEIELYARTGAGILYGIATLRQLLRKSADGLVAFPKCCIEDYPDIPYRFASRWLIELESSRMAYDWGDGRENMIERYRRKIDFCMRHKINMAFFDGFEWQTDKYSRYIEDIRELNEYGRVRNVNLEFGGHVIGFGGHPGHTLEGARGLGGFNRVSYPNGDIYDCGRVPGEFDGHFPSITSDATRNGTCRSNEVLNRLKQSELADYVRKIEPSVLYLHSEDIALYEEFRRMWEHRCEACRRRWPSDEVASSEGAAGAIASGFQRLYDGVASVRNPKTGYDGARDCLVIFASPTYGAYYDSDAEWDKVSDFWTTISSLLGNKERILFCIREQFWRMDGKARRIPELADRLTQEGGGHGLFAFVVGGADLYTNSALFSAAPRLNHFCQGAKAIFNFNGGLFASAQEIYNSEYTWNLLSPYGVDQAEDYESAKTAYVERSVEMAYLQSDELLKNALGLCYGEASPEMEEFYHTRDLDNNFPLAIPFRLCRKLFLKPYKNHDREKQRRQWSGLHGVTVRAERVIARALQRSLPTVEVGDELKYLQGCLTFGIRFSAIVSDCFAEAPDLHGLQQRIRSLKEFTLSNYPHNFTSPNEGEMNLWVRYLDRLSDFICERSIAADRLCPCTNF